MPPTQLWGSPAASRPLVQNEAWQARFEALFNRTNITTEPYPYRRINTAEDVLDLLHDVEEDIKRGNHQNAAPTRVHGKVESSSKEQWPPHFQSDAHLTSAGEEQHPHVRLPASAANLPPHQGVHPSRQHLMLPPETATHPVLDGEPERARVRLPHELLTLPAARLERFNIGAEAFPASSSADSMSIDDDEERLVTTTMTGSKTRNPGKRGARGRGQRLKRSRDHFEDHKEHHAHKKRAMPMITDTKTRGSDAVSRSSLDDMDWSNTPQRLSPPPQWDAVIEPDASQFDGNSKKRRLQEGNGDSHADKRHERRRQKLRNTMPECVDRYVPLSSRSHQEGDSKTLSLQPKENPESKASEAMNPPASFAGFTKLPGDLQDKILTMLLKSDDAIGFNTSELLPFVTKHARIPTAEHAKKSWVYSTEPATVRSRFEGTKSRLADVPHNLWRVILNTPQTGGLTLSLMLVSKRMHERAARIMYGSNTFHFSNADNAWMHLESFLATIGVSNTGHVRRIRLPAPRWYQGLSRDAIAGTLLDAVSPATHLAVSTTPASDRLVFAVETCTRALVKSGNLESLQIDVSFHVDVLHFIGESPRIPDTPSIPGRKPARCRARGLA